ncbi:hypothetical protein ACFQ1L_24460 [Phytohabitans flavus]|uniref:Uncharacterized protein n=1 Tax=Phytohabitans flavus TaxID=1076124 RepID=A0A6F8XSE5_9ACTN|nr:hypothetical protein [Phytohabitans flavus]BCB76717.1 hypothetical protein Pflav_031270 [Phytohabitans flavus]
MATATGRTLVRLCAAARRRGGRHPPQTKQLDAALAEQGRAADSVRRIAQLALDVRWPFESAGRYADMLGRLAGLGFTEVTVHWSRPDGRGLPATAAAMVAAAHDI